MILVCLAAPVCSNRCAILAGFGDIGKTVGVPGRLLKHEIQKPATEHVYLTGPQLRPDTGHT